MNKLSIDGFTIFFNPQEAHTAGLIREAVQRSVYFIKDHLGLDKPFDCRIYVMTCWLGFVFQSAPLPWKILLAITMPFWVLRVIKIWKLAGGWQQRYGNRQAIGIKPPRLLQAGKTRIGERIFIKEENIDEKIKSITCHELTHAFTSNLRLPSWLNEGLSMVMVDRYFEKVTVQASTLAVLENSIFKSNTARNKSFRIDDEDALVYLYTRGYWLCRYIDETRPGLLKELLAMNIRDNEYELRIAKAYEKPFDEFWAGIDKEIVTFLKTNSNDRMKYGNANIRQLKKTLFSG